MPQHPWDIVQSFKKYIYSKINHQLDFKNLEDQLFLD